MDIPGTYKLLMLWQLCAMSISNLVHSVEVLKSIEVPRTRCTLEVTSSSDAVCRSLTDEREISPVDGSVPGDSVCVTQDKDCLICRKGSVEFEDCPHIQMLDRKKRGFFKKLFRKARIHIPRHFPGIPNFKHPAKRFWFGNFGHRPIVRKSCPPMSSPAHGGVLCKNILMVVNVCDFHCDKGYTIVGASRSTCNRDGKFRPSPPTCRPNDCRSKPKMPAHGRAIHCSNGYKYQSACTVSCQTGYAPARGAHAVCSAGDKWILSSWKCDDIVSPVFKNCPKLKINTIDQRYKWEQLIATDNSGKVKVKQVQGQPPGTVLEFGVHIIKYSASDDSGNTAKCLFTVEVKETDCPKPSSQDPDMTYMCNGLTVQSVCRLSCASGTYIEGSKYISCVEAKSVNSTSYWEPIEGTEAKCFKKTCPTLRAPKNGALACDKQFSGTICQLQCDETFDVEPGKGTGVTYVCGTNSQSWNPSSVVPDCTELAYPDEYFLPTEFHYYFGDCNDEETLRQIKQQFLDNLNSVGLSPCMQDTCSVDDIDVSCGDFEDVDDMAFRKKRSTPKRKRLVRIRLTFHLKNSNKTMSPTLAKNLLRSLAEKSKKMMSYNQKLRQIFSKIQDRVLLRPSSKFDASGFKQIFSKIQDRVLLRPSSKFDASGFKFSGIGTMSNVGVQNFRRKGMMVRPMMNILPTAPPPSSVKLDAVTGNMTMTCSSGRVQMDANSGVCVPCSAGSYHSKKTESCVPCPLNTYQDKTGSTSCISCPNDHTTSTTGSSRRTECLALCTRDTFSPTGNPPCYPCMKGTYQDRIGSKTCTQCPGSKVKGQRVLPTCINALRVSGNATSMPAKLQISDFLLTCDKEVCLAF